MNKRLLIVPVVLAAAAAAAYLYVQLRSETDPNLIRVSGNIEVNDVEVSFRIPGWIEARPVSEGESIPAGDLIARLDSTELAQEVDLRRAEVGAYRAELDELVAGSRPEEIAQAEAAAAQARARLDELLAGSRPQEIAAAKAEVRLAQAELERASADFERQKELLAREVAAQQAYDRAKSEYEVAKSYLETAQEQLKLVEEGPRQEQIDHARAVLAEAEQQLALVREGPRQEEIARASARLEQIKQGLAIAETRLGYATLTSPISGVILSENVEAGEYIVPGVPVVTVGNLADVWLRAYVNETELGRVKLGQTVCVGTDTYPGDVYAGRLSFIASEAEFTPKSVQTTEERVKLVYRVKIDIPNPKMELKPGMPADADIWVGEGEAPCLP